MALRVALRSDLAGARPLFERALAIRDKTRGHESPVLHGAQSRTGAA